MQSDLCRVARRCSVVAVKRESDRVDRSGKEIFMTAETLQGWSIMQNVETCTEAPDSIAYVKLMPDLGHPMRAFGTVPLTRVQVLTIVKCPDGYWRVWGLSENYFPPAVRVLRGSEE